LRGDQEKTSANQIEAVYLYNFSKFVEWPASAKPVKSEPFNICILGEDPFGATLRGARLCSFRYQKKTG
jgi:hypothetical protein